MTDQNAQFDGKKPSRARITSGKAVKYVRFWLRAFAGPLRRIFTDRLVVNLRSFSRDKQLLVWVLALTIGAAVAYAAIGFRLLIGLFQLPWLFTTSERVGAAANLVPWWTILLAPALGGLVVGLILDRFAPGKRAHSVADVIEARAISDCRIDPKTGLLSALLSAISLGFGASAGREGPVVHLGATLASWIEDKFQLSKINRRALLASGVAAAVSASFNAPIAGVLFAHEVILAHYAVRAFVPIVIASVAAGAIARLHLGDFPAFIIPSFEITSYWEFPAFLLLGAVCAAVAIVFQIAVMITQHVSWRIEMPLWLRAGIGGFLVGLIALAFPQVLGVGYEATDQALSQQLPLWLLLSLIIAKTAATAITLACRFSVGIFSPVLYLGAMTGAAFGIIATSLVPDASSSASLYAILGMGGVAASVLGAPISTTMIVFELTGGFSMSIALLTTISIAVGLNNACLGQSFFHWQLNKRGLFLQDGPHRAILRHTTVADFMTLLPEGDSDSRLEKLQDPSLRPTDTLEHALRLFDRVGAATIPVVALDDPMRIIARAHRMTAVGSYNKALVDSHVEEHR